MALSEVIKSISAGETRTLTIAKKFDFDLDPLEVVDAGGGEYNLREDCKTLFVVCCPFGQPGDRLELWHDYSDDHVWEWYDADGDKPDVLDPGGVYEATRSSVCIDITETFLIKKGGQRAQWSATFIPVLR